MNAFYHRLKSGMNKTMVSPTWPKPFLQIGAWSNREFLQYSCEGPVHEAKSLYNDYNNCFWISYWFSNSMCNFALDAFFTVFGRIPLRTISVEVFRFLTATITRIKPSFFFSSHAERNNGLKIISMQINKSKSLLYF